MKLNADYVLRQIAGHWMVLPIGQSAMDFSGMIRLNETGAMLWKLLESGCDKQALVAALTQEYNVTSGQADADVEEFLDKLVRSGCLER